MRSFSPFIFARLGSKTVRDLSSSLDKFIKGRLWLKILFALTLGIVLGIVLSPTIGWISQDTSSTLAHWLALPGHIFLSMIKLVIIPLVFASLILGIVSSDSLSQLRVLGLKVGIYYVITTVVAVLLGFAAAYALKPGRWIRPEMLASLKKPQSALPPLTEEAPTVGSLLSGLIPNNPFDVLVSGEMLQVVLLAVFVGIALMSLANHEAKPLVDLLNTFQKLSMIVIGWAMHLAPLAVFGLTFNVISQMGLEALWGLGFYVLTVVAGLTSILLFYLLLVAVLGNRNPIRFLHKIKEVQLLAFSTSSSASVMPMTIEVAEKELSVRSSVSQFVIPLGTTINMGGTAMYQAVATVFLSQIYGIDLSFAQLGLVVVMATLSSVGAPGAPGVGIAVLAVILNNVGIPAEGILLIIGLDRFLDMCRTVINVTGDLVAAIVMDRLMPNDDSETTAKVIEHT